MKINKYKKLLAILILALAFTSCHKNYGDLNKAWDNRIYEPTIPALYNKIVSSLVDPGNAGTIFTSWIYQNTQLAAMYAASGYRMDNQVGPFWDNYYLALANSKKVEEMIEASPDVAKMTNLKAMVKTLVAYQTLKTTFLYGDMPYSEAGKAFVGSASDYRPKYDSQADIIKSALNDLKWAVESFSTSSTQISLGSAETLFAGDISKWIKFANSLRLRYAVSIHQKDATTANTVIGEALAKPLLAPSDNYGLYPASLTNYFNDRGGWYRGNSYVRMGSTMWNAMSSTNATNGSGIYDLRAKIFFEPNRAGSWVPYPQVPTNTTPSEIGNNADNDPYAQARLTTWAPASGTWNFAPLNIFYVADRTFPQLIITGSEVSLIKAEIYNRGIGGVAANATTAKNYYEEGITESVKFWYNLANGSSVWTVNKPAATPTASELNSMLTNTAVAYSSNAATALSQIYKQHWIALFHQPFEAWILARRTNYATPSVALATTSPGYNIFRLIYPQSEIDSNNENWRTVTGGTDSPDKKPWFMP